MDSPSSPRDRVGTFLLASQPRVRADAPASNLITQDEERLELRVLRGQPEEDGRGDLEVAVGKHQVRPELTRGRVRGFTMLIHPELELTAQSQEIAQQSIARGQVT